MVAAVLYCRTTAHIDDVTKEAQYIRPVLFRLLARRKAANVTKASQMYVFQVFAPEASDI